MGNDWSVLSEENVNTFSGNVVYSHNLQHEI